MNGIWRWLPLRADDAARNMAVDEAIFRAYALGLVPPTLRCYTWSPPGVSCGRFQDPAVEVDLAACAARGYGVVRRPTGGRAVLHEGDLTYAAIVGERDGLPAGTLPAYLHLSRGLLAGLTSCGIPAELHTPAGKDGRRSPACFASPSWYELTVGGRKVAGSAQRREAGSVLQHGAIMLSFFPDHLAAILRSAVPRAELAAQLAEAAAGLHEFAPGLAPAALADALRAGFADALRVEMAEGILTEEEEILARDLRLKFLSLSGERQGAAR